MANSTTTVTDFEAKLSDLFSEAESATNNDLVRSYFDEGEAGFSGAKFEALADRDPYRITANDLVAVSALGVSVPAHVSIWLLGEGRRAVAELLRRIPADVDIWDAGDLLDNGREAWQLWELLGTGCWPAPKQSNGMGGTLTSKLMAAKRPRLIPVRDSVVRQVLPSTGQVWADFRRALADSALRDAVARSTTAAPEHVSLLRRLDVVLWMRGRRL